MRVFLKIVVTIVFFMFWGGLARGCQSGAKEPVSALLSNIFTLILLGAGIYGIWKFNPDNPKIDDDQKLNKD